MGELTMLGFDYPERKNTGELSETKAKLTEVEIETGGGEIEERKSSEHAASRDDRWRSRHLHPHGCRFYSCFHKASCMNDDKSGEGRTGDVYVGPNYCSMGWDSLQQSRRDVVEL